MMTKFIKNKKHIFIFFLFGFLTSAFYLYFWGNPLGQNTTYSQKNLPVLSERELKNYNGKDPKKPIYVGLDGYVYDVTSGREFYMPGASYHYLAGKDSTEDLKIFGGNIIKRKYPIVAILKK